MLAALAGLSKAPKAVLLDPDTGGALGKPRSEHVTFEEIQEVWAALSPGDCLVIHQHAFRLSGWVMMTRDRLAEALGGVHISTFQCPELASNVAFFAAV